MKRRLVTLLTFCLVLVFLMASLAIAKESQNKKNLCPPAVSSDLICGCFKKVNGQLRVVSGPGQCHPSEAPIFWNQAGPPGPQGPQGPQGPPGPPPTLWIAHQGIDAVPLAGVIPDVVLSLLVPAGSYAISAKVSVTNLDPAVQDATCVLIKGTSSGDQSVVVLGAAIDDSTQVISLLDDATFATDMTITLRCDTTNGEARNGVLSAIEVEIAPQPEPN